MDIQFEHICPTIKGKSLKFYLNVNKQKYNKEDAII